ncbi:hypothetical protein BEH94_09110 [Candidatus Altiarchaeales archaeon WOR_SM1_SCG]|nr:hypothetical protein BEH94_09110 [Candidatus Altiarchaeales archaeon WOR_SM1_SCG]
MTTIKQQILETLKNEPWLSTPRSLANKAGTGEIYVWKVLKELVDEEKVKKVERGIYKLKG